MSLFMNSGFIVVVFLLSRVRFFSDPMDCSLHKILCPWDFPGKSTGVGFHFLLQGIFLTRNWIHVSCIDRLFFFFLTTELPGKPWTLVRQIIYLDRFISWFSSVTQSYLTLCDLMNHSTPGLPVHHQIPEFTQTHVHQVSDVIQPPHPLSSRSLPAPNPSQHQGIFQWVNSSHEVAKVLEFQLQHQSFQWTLKIDLL